MGVRLKDAVLVAVQLKNDCRKGGLSLLNNLVRADSLLMKQFCRMLSLPGEDGYRMAGYWVGSFLEETGNVKDVNNLRDLQV